MILACLPFVFLHQRLSLEVFVQRMYAGLDSFVLLAVPFFILAATIMIASGVTDRLIDLARMLVGWIAADSASSMSEPPLGSPECRVPPPPTWPARARC